MEKKNVLEEKRLKEVILMEQIATIEQTSNEDNKGTVNIKAEPNKETLSKPQEQEANNGTDNAVDEANKETSTDPSIEQQLSSSVDMVGKDMSKVIYPSNWSYPANLREPIRDQIELIETEAVSINIEELIEQEAQVQEAAEPPKTSSPSARHGLNNLFKQVKKQLDSKLTTQSASKRMQPRKHADAISIIINNKPWKEIPPKTKPQVEEGIDKQECLCSNCRTSTVKWSHNDTLPYVRSCRQQINKCLSDVLEIANDGSIADTTNQSSNALTTASLMENNGTNIFQRVELKHPLITLTNPTAGKSLEDIAKQIRQDTHSTLDQPKLSRRVLHGFVSFVRGIFYKAYSLINENFSFILFFIFFSWFLYVAFGYIAKIPNLKYYQGGRKAL